MKTSSIQTLIFSSFLFILALFSCNDESSSKKKNTVASPDTNATSTADSLDTVELKDSSTSFTVTQVRIDSSNHQKYLQKDGSYRINWGILGDVEIQPKYYEEYEAEGFYAYFGPSPVFLKNKTVVIEGYVIRLIIKEEQSYFLSMNPNSSCFFCTNVGPETILELFLKPDHKKFLVDEYHKFKGRLELNNGNPWMLNYLLYEAEQIKTLD